MLAENGYTKPFQDNDWKVIVTLSSETPANECLTLAIAGRNSDNLPGCVIFGIQKVDTFGAVSVEYEYKHEEDYFAEITSVDWDFFQGSTPGNLSSDLDIIGYVEIFGNSETLVGEKAIVI